MHLEGLKILNKQGGGGVEHREVETANIATKATKVLLFKVASGVIYVLMLLSINFIIS